MSTFGSRTRSFSNVFGTADLAGARQKHQQRAGFGTQRALDRIRHLTLDRRTRIAAQIARLDRKRAALAFDHRRIAEQRRNPRAIERRRHHQQLEIRSQTELRIARQSQSEIGIERAFVEFVEQYGGDAVERGIVENQAA